MDEKTIQKLLEYLESTKDFAMEHLPDVVQQALVYEKVSACMTMILMLSLCIAAIGPAYYSWMYPVLNEHGSRELFSYATLVFPCCIFPLLFTQLCSSIDQVIKIYLAPKYFLIQLIMDMRN